MKPTLDFVGDTFESDLTGSRSKRVHTVGVVAKVKFETVANNEGYTGIFTGSNYGLIRFSAAIKPDYTKTTAAEALGNFVPAFAVKFLRDGVHSGNVMGMYSIVGDSSWNFFKNVLSNHIPGTINSIGSFVIAHKFATASHVINIVGLSDLATYGEDGVKVSSPKFPFQLIYTPNSVLTAAYTDDFQATFFSQIS